MKMQNLIEGQVLGGEGAEILHLNKLLCDADACVLRTPLLGES